MMHLPFSTDNCNDGDGTYFLQENMVLRGSSSFCLYDTRSLSDNESENTDILNQWMTEGVRHGELVIRSVLNFKCLLFVV